MENLELMPCSFEFCNFVENIGEVSLICQIIKMKDSLYIWVGDNNEKNMMDLSFALPVPNDPKKQITSTKIIGPISDDTSSNIASRLSKKVGKPVYLSYNLMTSHRSLPSIEKRIHEEFIRQPHLIKF